jgi:hypothetical protein
MCWFCGKDTASDGYVELTLRIADPGARQFLRAHRTCLVDRLAKGVELYLDEPSRDSD